MLSSGESGIRPMSKEKYKEECDPEFMSTFFCNYFGVEEPTLKENPSTNNGRWRGYYYRNKRLVSFNSKMTGIILHELAHHVVNVQGRNGRGHHDYAFWSVLQEMHDLWR